MNDQPEFGAMLLRVVAFSLLFFGIATAALVYFVKGLSASDTDKTTRTGLRAAILVVSLLAIGVLFIYISYR